MTMIEVRSRIDSMDREEFYYVKEACYNDNESHPITIVEVEGL